MQFRYAAAVILAAGLGSGQTLVDLRTQSKSVDFTGAITTKPFKSGTFLPATCTVGEAFFKTNAPAGSNLYTCTSLNSWTLQLGASGPQGPAGMTGPQGQTGAQGQAGATGAVRAIKMSASLAGTRRASGSPPRRVA